MFVMAGGAAQLISSRRGGVGVCATVGSQCGELIEDLPLQPAQASGQVSGAVQAGPVDGALTRQVARRERAHQGSGVSQPGQPVEQLCCGPGGDQPGGVISQTKGRGVACQLRGE